MDKIQANVILEILGRPKEHITEALNNLINKLGTEKGTKIIEKTLHDPIEVENSKDLFTTFAEILVELDSLDSYFGLIFAYMPSNIEIIAPQKTTLANTELNELASKIIHRLHDYDAIAKKAIIENQLLAKKIQEENLKLSNPMQNKKAEQKEINTAKKDKKTAKSSKKKNK